MQVDTAQIVADMLDRGWNQSEMSRRSGVHESTLSRFIAGEHQTAKTLKRIAKALGRKPSDYSSVVTAAA